MLGRAAAFQSERRLNRGSARIAVALTASSTERAGSAKIKKTVTEEDMVSAQNGSLSRLWREAMLLRPGVSTDTNFDSMAREATGIVVGPPLRTRHGDAGGGLVCSGMR